MENFLFLISLIYFIFIELLTFDYINFINLSNL